MKKRQLPIFARVILAGLTCLIFAQCGKSKSQKVSFDVVPKPPIVITADTVVNGSPITAPWFRFQVNVANKADDSVVIVAFSIKVTPTNFGESVSPTNASVVPSAFNYTATDGSVTCIYVNFDTIAKGYEGPITLTPDGTSIGCTAGQSIPVFVIPSNPKPPDGTTQTSYRYRVEVTPQGWFGDATHQRDRFTRTFIFYTQ